MNVQNTPLTGSTCTCVSEQRCTCSLVTKARVHHNFVQFERLLGRSTEQKLSPRSTVRALSMSSEAELEELLAELPCVPVHIPRGRAAARRPTGRLQAAQSRELRFLRIRPVTAA